jgi:hypothetical protein
MNSQSQRRVIDDPVESELIEPLSGPSYGPFSVVKRRWQKPIPAIIADVKANSQALIARLECGVRMPDMEGKPRYQTALNYLTWATQQQLKALETFSAIDWE